MQEPDRRVVDYASAGTPSPDRADRGLTVGQFGCALVTVVYGIPLLVILILVFVALSQRD
jgi:hypothetical protein